MFEVLEGRNPVLWFSGGDDSTLLLALLREAGQKFDIVQSRDFWTRDQEQRTDELIKKWDLTIYSMAPQSVGWIGDDEHISSVFNYKGMRIIKDVLPGTRCYENVAGFRPYRQPFKWDLYIVGSRATDTHWSVPTVIDTPVVETEVTIYAPLFDWTRDEVSKALEERGLLHTRSDDTDTGNLFLCTKCLDGPTFCPKLKTIIPQVKWDRTENLRAFNG